MDTILFHTTDWSEIPVTEYPGETGIAFWKTLQYKNLRIRMVEYSRGYIADHWCKRGHIVYCIEGEMTIELSDGRKLKFEKGMTYQVSDAVNPHRSVSCTGTKLLIIDGAFLKTNTKPAINPWKM